jgi:hypothetical protein
VTRINVAIAVAGEARDRIYEVATACRAFGFGHTSTRSDIGVLKGSVELEDLPTLRAVPGVLAIEIEDQRVSRGAHRSPAVRIRSGSLPRGRTTRPPPEN